MAYAVPSLVCSLIRQQLPRLGERGVHTNAHEDGLRQKLQAIIDLSDRIPEHLFPWRESDLSDYVLAISALKATLRTWETAKEPNYFPVPDINGRHPASIALSILEKYPDHVNPQSDVILSFIDDISLRNSIREDISAAESALKSHEYKSSTVMAGAAIEALLEWLINIYQKSYPIEML